MGFSGLAVGRLRAERLLVLAACLAALFATTALAALTGYTGSVAREALRRSLDQATFDAVGTRLAAPIPAGAFPAAERDVAAALRAIYGDVPVTTSVSARSDSYTLPGQEDRERPDLTAFATYSGIERHATLSAGRWPAGGRTGEVEAALPEAAARALGVDAGAVMTLRGRIDDSSVVRVRVTGLFTVRRPGDYFWQGDRLVTTGVEKLTYTTYGPLVVPPDVFAARFTATGAYARWTVLPDLRGVDPDGLARLGERVAAGAGTFRQGRSGAQFTMDTRLPELTARLSDALTVSRSTMLVPVVQLVLLAGYALLLVARLLADHRRMEVALLRTRGASIRQLTGLTLAEGLAVVLPAAVLAPLLAGPLLRLAGRASAVRDSGLRLDVGPAAPLWAVSAGAALACALLLAAPVLHGATRTYVQTRAGLGRAGRGGALRRSGADLALAAVAALGLWQLTRYGGPVTRTRGSGLDFDPFIVVGPALTLLSGGMLLLRLLPPLARIAERLTARRRGLTLALGARQIGRRPLSAAGPALLLVMAMAVGVLSVATTATWRRSQLDQADFQSGTDLRTAAAQQGAGPLGTGARLAALPGVTGVSPVLRSHITVGYAQGTLLAADTAVLDRLLRVRPDLAHELAAGSPDAERPRAPLITVPGRPATLSFGIRVTPRGEDRDKTEHRMQVTVVDGRGLAQQAELTGLVADGRTRTVTLRVADLAGPGGTPTYPLAVRGFRYAYDDNPPTGPLEIAVLGLRGDQTEAKQAGGGWNVFSKDRENDLEPLTPATGPNGLVTLTVPQTPPLERRETDTGVVVHALAADARSGSRSPASEQPAVPGLITSALAAQADVGVGDTFTLGSAHGDQRITVSGIVRALPTTAPEQPAALVDLPTLNEGRLGAGADPLQPAEWWLGTRDGHTAPAVAALGTHREWGEVLSDRVQARRALRDAPLGGALQGALMLGFLAALAFAVIGFVVNLTMAARERTGEFTVLQVLGVRARQVLGMLAVEQAFLVTLGLAGGMLLGLTVAALVVPNLVLTASGAAPYPAVDLVVDWPPVLVMLGGVMAVLGLALLLVVRMLRRRGLGAELRRGEAL